MYTSLPTSPFCPPAHLFHTCAGASHGIARGAKIWPSPSTPQATKPQAGCVNMEGGAIHCYVSNLSLKGENGRRRSAVAKAAYNSGQNLWLEAEQRMTTLRQRYDVVHTEILVPNNTPEQTLDWCTSREKLWNRVEASAKRKDARLAKNIQAAITRGIPKEQWPEMVRKYTATFVEAGHVVDIAIHDDGVSDNPHVHLMLTVNALQPNGFGAKIKSVDQKSFVPNARKRWAEITNEYLAANGLPLKVSHKSYAALGITQQATKHRGPNQRERAEKYARQQTQGANAPTPKQEHIMSERDHPKPKLNRPTAEQQSFEETIPLQEPELAKQDWFTDAWRNKEAEQPPAPNAPDIITDEDLRDRTGLTVQSHAERQLLLALQNAPDEVQHLVEDELAYQQRQRSELAEQRERLDVLSHHLTIEQQTLLDDLLEDQHQHYNEHPFPERGPDDALTRPQDLATARERMVAEYEQEEPDR